MIQSFARNRPLQGAESASVVASTADRTAMFLRANPITVEWLDREKQCVRCRKMFRERDNIGAWQCNDHLEPISRDPQRPLVEWRACCRRPPLSAGCRPADHIAEGDVGRSLYIRVVDGFAGYLAAPQADAVVTVAPAKYDDLTCEEDRSKGGDVYEQWAAKHCKIMRRCDNLLR